jgi:hypothetical protein
METKKDSPSSAGTPAEPPAQAAAEDASSVKPIMLMPFDLDHIVRANEDLLTRKDRFLLSADKNEEPDVSD